jgi:hypothetical protein
VTSVALAVVALLVCWIPWIGIVSLSLSLVGLVLGVVALIMALARRNTGLGFPAAGSVLSFLTLLLVTQLILSAIEGPLKMISGLTGGGTTGSGGGIGALLGEPGAADPGQQGQPRITRESTARVSREPIESQTEPEPADPSPQTQDSEAPGEPSTAAPDNADGEPKDTGAAQNLAATAGAASADGAPKEPKRPAAAPDAEPGEGDAAKGSEGSSGTTAAEDEFAEQVAAVREALQRRSDPTGQPDRTRRMRQRPQVQRQRQPQQPQQDQEKNPAKDAEGSEGPDEKQDSSGDPGWIPASEAAIYNGELEVRIVSAKVGRFSVPDLLGNRQRRMRLFGVTVRLHNRSDQRKYDYLSWTGPGIDLNDAVHSQNPMATLRKLTQGAQSEMRPQLADNFGNRYEQHIGASTDYLLGGGGPETESIRPGESIEDTILFEEPVAKADQLRLQLPARYFGGEGVIRFEIPAEMVEGLE